MGRSGSFRINTIWVQIVTSHLKPPFPNGALRSSPHKQIMEEPWDRMGSDQEQFQDVKSSLLSLVLESHCSHTPPLFQDLSQTNATVQESPNLSGACLLRLDFTHSSSSRPTGSKSRMKCPVKFELANLQSISKLKWCPGLKAVWKTGRFRATTACNQKREVTFQVACSA